MPRLGDDEGTCNQDILFMCCSADVFNDLCELFPQTKENLMARSKKRRNMFMKQKRTRSKAWNLKKKEQPDMIEDDASDIPFFDSEEDQGERDQQKEDMQKYLEEQVINLESVNKALIAAN